MTVQDELLALRDEDGLIRVHQVEEWARKHPESELHKRLEWDNAKAGLQYRLWQCRELISIYVRNEKHEPLAVSLSIDRVNPGGGFRLIEDVLDNPTLVEVMLGDALKELRRVREKFRHLSALAKVWRELDAVEREAAKKEEMVPA